ncbi:MAG: SBBP repeat-containing protein [Candidatus Kapabacteria bacterium]|nr:SBBP repeat-containing protein [Candidatus Kapabacteria bacterium]
MKRILPIALTMILYIVSNFSLLGQEITFSKNVYNLSFIENKGQWQEDIKFIAQKNNLNLIVTKTGLIYDFFDIKGENQTRRNVITMELIGGNQNIQSSGLKPLDIYYNFFKGNDETKWATNCKTYQEIVLNDVYNNIDLVLMTDEGNPRYDFIIKKGGNPENIRIKYNGVPITLIKDNNITLKTVFGEIFNNKLRAFQIIDNETKIVECKFKWINEQSGLIGFDVGQYDKNYDLIIDPIVFGGYFGGSATDEMKHISVGKNGEFVVIGTTNSLNFKTTPGAYDEVYNDDNDIFISKFLSYGSEKKLIFSTFVGGGMSDNGSAVKLDSKGNIYFTGWTNSADFPYKGGYSKDFNGGYDSYIVKLDNTGSNLIFSSFLGGSKDDFGTDIDLTPESNPVICGYSDSKNFPTGSGAFQSTNKGLNDIFVSCFSNTGTALVYSTLIGGTSDDKAYALAVDESGYVYLTGETSSGDFPVAPFRIWGSWVWDRPYDYSYNGGKDAFALKLIGNGGKLEFSTFFGGTQDDIGRAVYYDEDGTLFFAGETKKETNRTFPVTESAYMKEHKGGWDCFFAKMDKPKQSGTWGGISQNLIFSTFFGGSGDDYIMNIVRDPKTQSLYFTGKTNSTNYPVEASDVTKPYGRYDAFLTRFYKDGSGLLMSTFIGGGSDDVGTCVDVDSRGDVYLVGTTSSNDFKNSVNTIQPAYGGGTSDGFFVKFVTGEISITSPSSNEKVCRKQNLSIEWSSSGFAAGDKFFVDIINPSTSKVINIGKDITANKFNWVVPEEFESGTYHLMVSHESGLSFFKNNIITVQDPPKIKQMILSSQNTTFCEGDNFTIQVDAEGPNLKYTWYHNNIIIEGQKDPKLELKSLNVDNTGNYKVIVTGACDPPATSDIISITVLPTTSIKVHPRDTTVKVGTYVKFSVEATGDNLTYEWQWNGEKLLGGTEKDYVINSAQKSLEGKFRCIVRGTCKTDTSREATLVVDTTTTVSVDELMITGLKLYLNENVVENNLTVQINSEISTNLTLEIFDFLGNLKIQHSLGFIETGNHKFEFNLNDFASGVYWLRLNEGQRYLIRKFIVFK